MEGLRNTEPMLDWNRTEPSKWLATVLGELRRESRSAMLNREATLFDQLAGPFREQIILFGSGALGRFALAGLRRAGIEPVALVDNDARLWGKPVEGVEVLSPSDAVNRHGKAAAFVVTIYNGTSVRDQLRAMGCHRVLPFAPMFWKYSEVFIPDSCLDLPHRMMEHTSEMERCYAVLEDDLSRREFCEQIAWRGSLDYDVLSPPCDARNIYFEPDLIRGRDDEVFVDCGAFDGDSVRSFLSQRGERFGHVYATEPDPANRVAFDAQARGLPDALRARITLWPYAVGAQNARVRFKATSTAGSRVDASGTYEAECRSLDDVLMEQQVVPTYIKMDIEGAEPEAIEGAARTLSEHAPVLAVCLYHRCDHLWRIPLLIKKLAPDYNIFIRRYAEECWELVCYAVLASRLI